MSQELSLIRIIKRSESHIDLELSYVSENFSTTVLTEQIQGNVTLPLPDRWVSIAFLWCFFFFF